MKLSKLILIGIYILMLGGVFAGNYAMALLGEPRALWFMKLTGIM